MTERGRNQTIDVVRIVASFFVILCHIHLPGWAKDCSMGLARFAVPFFLLVTGWYLFDGDDSRAYAMARRTLVSILKLTVLSVLLVAAVNTLVCLIRGRQMFSWVTGFFRRSGSWLLFLLYNRTHWLSSVMWYLFGLLYALVIYLVLVRLRVLKYAFWLIPLLLILNIVRGEVLGKAWYYQGNWLFTSLPFLLLGSLFRSSGWCTKIANRTAWWLIAAGIAATCVEAYFFGEQIIHVGTLPLALGIFCLAVNGGETRWPAWLSYFGRRCTKYVFLLHCSLRDLVYALAGTPSGALLWLMPAFFFLLSGAIGWGISMIQDKRIKA